MSDLVRRDAAHGGTHTGIGGERRLPERHDRAPGLANAAFHGVLERQVHERSRRRCTALDDRDRHAESTREGGRDASVAAFVPCGARSASQQSLRSAVSAELAAQGAKGIDAGGLEPSSVGQETLEPAPRATRRLF